MSLFTSPPVLRTAARFVARFGPRRISFGATVLVFRWADVADVLERDGDFRIAPVNAGRIEAVSGPFMLGMDRSAALYKQREAVYGAMHAADKAPVAALLANEPARLLGAALAKDGSIDVVNGYARLVAARVAAAYFGIAGPSEADLMRVARAVFQETFLNLGGDKTVEAAGIAAGRELTGWIAAERAARLARGAPGADVLGRLLALEQAGLISGDEAAHMLAGLLVGAIDTTATAVANIMAEIVADHALQQAMMRDVDDAPRLAGWCWEVLRRRPHNPLVLRQAIAGASAAGKPVKAGARVFAITLSAMQDGRVFDDPKRMDPGRPPLLYMHFGRALHACAGRDINAIQIPALVAGLLRHGAGRRSGVSFAGPFPDKLVVSLRSPT
ncbi:MAG TPA: cytochrome P450 [Rhizomicrobium sp.]|jgi:cytochrome P450|nr:cytochrome P450 [Rhizomicrobium sp.]